MTNAVAVVGPPRTLDIAQLLLHNGNRPDGDKTTLYAHTQRKNSMEALRDYQEDLLQQVETYIDANDKARVMMQLPTGGGKTVIAGHLLQRRLGNGRKAVWLTHRKELAEQTCGMLTNARVAAVTNLLWTPGTDAPAVSGGAVILMAQTVSRRTDKMQVWNKYDSNDLMVIDEAHHAAAKGWERAMQQWPGPVVGMTATPWRLSEKEGFDHLFDDLICGPQIADLQSNGWLCDDKVFMPHPDLRIRGGEVGGTGDYTESGIESANFGRDIMTAGALEFWQERARARQTIVYAVSVRHAHNIVKVFQNAGFSAEVILGDTDPEERGKTIAKFRDGDLHVLVNVVVATEGFDLPDASCVLITRPTLSLALFMQMIGRGLRPKEDRGDCIILDLTGNSMIHGLPQDSREWSLEPRGKPPPGEAPIVWCRECGGVNYAASHYCQHCGAALGMKCLQRCGKWRPWSRWRFENHCGDVHELVCDFCHRDTHIRARLPINPPLDEMPDLQEDDMELPDNIEMDDELAERLAPLLTELLEQERQKVMGDRDVRSAELSDSIQKHERVMGDNNALDTMFTEYVRVLPYNEQPQYRVERYRMFGSWESDLKRQLSGWKNELAELESQPVEKQLIFDNARSKLVGLLSLQAQDADLLPDDSMNNDDPHGPEDGWYLLSSSTNSTHRKPVELRTPDGDTVSVIKWIDILSEVAEWLYENRRLTGRGVPASTRKNTDRYMINNAPMNRNRVPYKAYGRLSNGLYFEKGLWAREVCRRVQVLSEISDPPAKFYVRMSE